LDYVLGKLVGYFILKIGKKLDIKILVMAKVGSLEVYWKYFIFHNGRGV